MCPSDQRFNRGSLTLDPAISCSRTYCPAGFRRSLVGCGSGASNWCRSQHFRFTPRTDVGADIIELPLSATSRQSPSALRDEHDAQKRHHSVESQT
jgi:hypothetical protein